MAFDGKMFAQALGKGLIKNAQGQKSGLNLQDAFSHYLKKKKEKESSGIDYAPGIEKAKEVDSMLTPGLELAKKNSLPLPPGLGLIKDMAPEISPIMKLGKEKVFGEEEEDDKDKKQNKFLKYLS